MKGNNAGLPASFSSLQESAMNLMKEIMSELVPGSEVKWDSEGCKVHVSQLGSDDIIALAGIAKLEHVRVTLKRSGIGITILIQYKD